MKIKIAVIILLSTSFGFCLSSMLSIPASKIYLEFIKLDLIFEHEKIAVKSIKNDNMNDALFHLKSADYLLSKKDQDAFKDRTKLWTFFYPIEGAVIKYFIDFFADDSMENMFSSASGNTIALYGHALEESGDLKAAEQKYKEAADILNLKNIDQVKKLIPSILATQYPTQSSD